MTEKIYLFDPALTGRAVIKGLIGNRVRLDQTLFHPQGGGQKADRGTIEGRPVLNVRHVDGDVEHQVESADGLRVSQEVTVEIDEAWRRSSSRWHSAGHLIAAVVERQWPSLKAVSGHHWAGEARVEFTGSGDDLVNEVAIQLPHLLAEAITEDQPVRISNDPLVDRTVVIGDYKPVPCGGTHVERTGQLPSVTIGKVRMKDGKLRVSYGLTDDVA
jgi:alanyl-tRNA synthetase